MSIEAPVETAKPAAPTPTPPATLDYARNLSWRGPTRYFADYFWFILKNVIGWIFILAAPVLGVTFPGPGGIPVFLIGFALVTFPGKRKITSRVMRGRPLRLESTFFTIATATLSILITAGLIWFFSAQYNRLVAHFHLNAGTDLIVALAGLCTIGFVVTWLVTRLMLQLVNIVLRGMPRARRFLRPLLRKWGINLLPTRRKRKPGVIATPAAPAPVEDPDVIIEISEKQQTRMRQLWHRSKPWVRHAAAVALTVWIVIIMVRPLEERWPAVQGALTQMNPYEVIGRFLVASGMFALFLFLFRAMVWRKILKGFGFKLPYAAATRIWSSSELARYLPGSIWQVIGRAFLAKPYGVPGSICSTSQILELCVFLLANVLLAVVCLLWYGAKIDEHARPYLIAAMVLVPALGILLHPKIFYGVVNAILGRIRKPPIVKRLRGKKLVGLLAWTLLGLLWQSLAVYVIAARPLHLKIDWWWMIAGAYCLAWTAGFLAFLSPAGIGVRELIFVYTMQLIIPQQVKDQFSDPAALAALLVFIGFTLRVWTIVGELMLTLIAHIADYRGTLNRPDAPGRVALAARAVPGFAVIERPRSSSSSSSSSSSEAASDVPRASAPS